MWPKWWRRSDSRERLPENSIPCHAEQIGHWINIVESTGDESDLEDALVVEPDIAHRAWMSDVGEQVASRVIFSACWHSRAFAGESMSIPPS